LDALLAIHFAHCHGHSSQHPHAAADHALAPTANVDSLSDEHDVTHQHPWHANRHAHPHTDDNPGGELPE